MAQQLRALISFAEDMNSVPSAHVMFLQLSKCWFRRISNLSLASTVMA